MCIKLTLLNLGLFLAGMAATPELKITAPPEGTVVAPGGVLMVTVEATPFAFQSVILAGKPIGFSDVLTAPPYRFGVRIWPDTPAGTDTLDAYGLIEPGKPGKFIASSLTIDVERPDTPLSLKTDFKTLSFDHVGDDFHFTLTGTFADGAIVGLTRSRYTSYRSTSAAVADVEADGHVTAKGAGSTVITIQHRDQSITVRVTVKDDEIQKQH
jgi:hypothetical protein